MGDILIVTDNGTEISSYPLGLLKTSTSGRGDALSKFELLLEAKLSLAHLVQTLHMVTNPSA